MVRSAADGFAMNAPPDSIAKLEEERACAVKAGGTPFGDARFGGTKPLDAMTPAEWESLCDGCARCCLVKLEDEDTGAIHYTDLGCTLLDGKTCRCRDYPNRKRHVTDCVKLTPEAVRTLSWLPVTCAYRVLAEGGDL